MPAAHNSIFTGRMLFLMPKQRCQSIEGRLSAKWNRKQSLNDVYVWNPVINKLLLLHLFNSFFSMTTWVSRHQKGKPFWILLEQETMGLQWHQLDHMEIICTSCQTDNHASTSPLSFYRTDALPAAQPTASKQWRQVQLYTKQSRKDLFQTYNSKQSSEQKTFHPDIQV